MMVFENLVVANAWRAGYSESSGGARPRAMGIQDTRLKIFDRGGLAFRASFRAVGAQHDRFAIIR